MPRINPGESLKGPQAQLVVSVIPLSTLGTFVYLDISRDVVFAHSFHTRYNIPFIRFS